MDTVEKRNASFWRKHIQEFTSIYIFTFILMWTICRLNFNILGYNSKILLMKPRAFPWRNIKYLAEGLSGGFCYFACSFLRIGILMLSCLHLHLIIISIHAIAAYSSISPLFDLQTKTRFLLQSTSSLWFMSNTSVYKYVKVCTISNCINDENGMEGR